ncbi:MAG TPA: WXG100 family type VII secretion target [Herpetosiphon sp.]|uniref:Protein glutaminase domain-containing protein n=1 Tax=Herpetosiphon aurantiacus (strain ATCC 23779 / DSM 785 / 114-95) TaxID=316274 RepID=A9B529_HERA2|nr:WXG100 family type VII secretion target [Herpetosiphon sp.]ABX06166.1 hypothetical protein Haur_3530 [Herpetosiphon aurantiacus DSM 785]HBW50098.1 WXG100 family type VII secretion target [Herpetosiphon sp.]
MPATIVQIDYAVVDPIIQRFQKLHDQSQTIQASLCQTMAALQAGQWQGNAANACFQEFDHVVKPAFQRLLHVLQGSVETTKAIRKIMADAEAEAAALFRGDVGAMAVGGNGAMLVQEADANTPTPTPPEPPLKLPFVQKLIELAQQLFAEWQKNFGDKVNPHPDGSVSEAEATIIFNDMANEPDIAFKYANDGCYARAHLMTYRIHERYGIPLESLEKAYIQASGTAPDTHLTVPTEYRYSDQKYDDVSSYDGIVDWGWHVAPTVKVRNNDGSITPMVIDPSLFSQPVSLETWHSKMNDNDAILNLVPYNWYTPRKGFEPISSLGKPHPNEGLVNYTHTKEELDISAEATMINYMKRCEDSGYCK